MKRFSDRLVESIRKVGNPCVVGLDPRINLVLTTVGVILGIFTLGLIVVNP